LQDFIFVIPLERKPAENEQCCSKQWALDLRASLSPVHLRQIYTLWALKSGI